VWKVPLASGAAWLKACAPVQRFEPRLTAALARNAPGVGPDVLAHDSGRGWLLLADAGEPIGLGAGPEPWLSVLPRYAQLQRRQAVQAAKHLAGGVPDHRPARFPALYEALLARELPLASGDRARLRGFAPRFRELCEELAAGGIPETIEHADLHGNNVFRRDRVLRILDWGDACVSHPFLTVFVTFFHLELPRGDPWFARLRDAYLEPWGAPAALRETFELAHRLGPFAHLFKELRVLDAIPEEARSLIWPGLPPLLALCLGVVETTRAAGVQP